MQLNFNDQQTCLWVIIIWLLMFLYNFDKTMACQAPIHVHNIWSIVIITLAVYNVENVEI